MTKPTDRSRWIALYILCLGDLMIVLDTTIVNVALPSIRADLGFSATSLAWVVNAYMLTFGGLLILAGRLGDLFGQRRVFLFGVGSFTVASLACGLSSSREMLIIARAVQGIGGATVSAVAFSLIAVLFSEPSARARAMGVFGFVLAGGGSLGVLAGGVLTDLAGWHWIFLVNLPIGVCVCFATLRWIPAGAPGPPRRLDVAGALAATVALVLAVYAIVNGNHDGWTSTTTLSLLAASLVLGAGFLVWEARAAEPLVPLALLRRHNVAVSNVVGVLWAGAMFAMFFLSALFLQLVRGYSPLDVGLAFLPGNVLMGLCSLGLSAKAVMRFGFRVPIGAGLVMAALSLAWLARAPVHGGYVLDVLPSMLLLGLGAGIAFNPILMAAMSDVGESDAGLVSGVINTSFMAGGALGLAVLSSLAAARTHSLTAGGSGHLAALTGGYHAAFALGAAMAVAAAVTGAALVRTRTAHVAEEALATTG